VSKPPPYASYRPSGLAWVSRIPAHWDVAPAWSIARQVRRAPSEGEGVVTAFRDGEVTLRTNRRVSGFTEAVQEHGYQGVRPGELVIHSMDAFAGAIGVSDSVGKMSPVAQVYQIDSGEARYFALLLRVMAGSGYVESLAKGIRERSTAFDRATFRALALPVPPVDEQRRILTYLDHETRQIDAFIAKNEELIALFTERRNSQIARAVSFGIDSAADTIATQKLALQRMPTHWSLVPLKRAVSYQEGPGILAVDFRETGVPLLRISSVNHQVATLDGCLYLDPEAVRARWAHFRVAMGDLLISASASMGTVSQVATEDVVGAIPYTGIIRISAGAMIREFAKWFFLSEEFLLQVQSLKTGSTIQHFGPSHLGQMWVALPPPPEQEAIAAHLRNSTSRIDEAIRSVERCVALARERRAALISAAVTGKIDVAEVA
jgi:type I restriction enzyme S subunit